MNKFVIPLIIQSLSALFIGLIDQAMIGRISVPAYSAVGLISTLLYNVVGLLGVIAVVLNIRGSKLIGEEDNEGFLKEFNSNLFLAVSIGVASNLLLLIIKQPLLTIVFQLTGETLQAATAYLSWMIWYIPLQLITFVFTNYSKIRKNTKIIMYVSFLVSILNIVLNYVFIFGKLGFSPMGAYGCGLATFISLTVQLLIYCYYARKDIQVRLISKITIIKQWNQSLPLAALDMLEGSIFITIIHAVLLRISNLDLSAFILVSYFVNIALMPVYMYGNALLTFISEAFGNKKLNDIRGYKDLALKYSFIIYVILAFIFILLRNVLPHIITNDLSLIQYATIFFLPLLLMNGLNVLQTIYKYALQALGQSNSVLKISFLSNLFSVVIMIVGVWLVKDIKIIWVSLIFNYLFQWIYYKTTYNKQILKIQ